MAPDMLVSFKLSVGVAPSLAAVDAPSSIVEGDEPVGNKELNASDTSVDTMVDAVATVVSIPFESLVIELVVAFAVGNAVTAAGSGSAVGVEVV